MKLRKKNMGLGLFVLAGLFLFNPTVSVVDILPDFIGYTILYFALRKLGDINDHIDTAVTYSKRMILVSASQFLSIIVLFGLVSDREKPTTYLLFSFVVAVFEIVFLSRLYGEFFEGMIYLASRKNGEAVLENRRTEKMSRLTVFFFTAKAVLSVLPEFSALTFRSGSKWEFIYDYVGLFRLCAALLMLPIGIVWFICLYRYIYAVTNDRPFMEQLSETYERDVAPKKEIFIQRFLAVAFVILSIGVCFSLDLQADYISILPDFICPLAILIALLFLRRFTKISGISWYFCIANLISSLATYFLTFDFFRKYTLLLTRNSAEAFDAYMILGALKTLDSALFCLMVLSLFSLLHNIIYEHAGYAPSSENNVRQEEKTLYIRETLTKRWRICRYLLFVASASTPVFFFLTRILYIARHASFLWIIEFIIYLVFVIYFIETLFAIKREVGYRYLLS